jgi:hypothetical protein
MQSSQRPAMPKFVGYVLSSLLEAIMQPAGANELNIWVHYHSGLSSYTSLILSASVRIPVQLCLSKDTVLARTRIPGMLNG